MTLVLDANVIVAAFATRGLCHALVESCVESHTIVLGAGILEEVVRVLEQKVRVPRDTVEEIARYLEGNAELHEPATVDADACRDRDDLHVLGVALAGRVDAIVTGDRHLLELGAFESIPILSPRDLWSMLRASP